MIEQRIDSLIEEMCAGLSKASLKQAKLFSERAATYPEGSSNRLYLEGVAKGCEVIARQIIDSVNRSIEKEAGD